MTLSAIQATSDKKCLPGFWIYWSVENGFILDEQCSAMLGLRQESGWISYERLLDSVSMDNRRRFIRTMRSSADGNILQEDIKIAKGPRTGNILVLHGSILLRDENGRASFAAGFLSQAESSFGSLLAREIANDGTWDWDADSDLVKFSMSYLAMLGYENPDEFPSTFVEWAEKIVFPEDRERTADAQLRVVESQEYGDYFECCIRLRHKRGHFIWTLGRGLVLQRDKDGRAVRLVGTNSNINLFQNNYDSIQQRLFVDALTGLHNREYFIQKNFLWEAESCRPLSLIYVDVTGLKLINDTLGHHAGDILLKSVARILKNSIQSEHEVIRLSGDEFLVILPYCSAMQAELYQHSIEIFTQEHNAASGEAPVILGLGVATWGEVSGETLTTLTRRADKRMQAAKEKQRAESHAVLKDWLESRLGRAVSLRDSRRLD